MSGRFLLRIQRQMLWVIAVAMLTCSASAQSNKRISASIQPARVTVGDTVSYQISIELTGAGQPSVAVPVISADTGLSTPSPAGQQSSVETYIENGSFRSVQKIIYSYSIRTSKEGTFTIPPATITTNGKSYETDPVQITVQSAPKATNVPSELQGLVAPPNISGNPELQRKLTGGIFVLPVLTKTDPYNGEMVRISYHLVIDPEALRAAGLQPRTNLDGVQIPPMNEFITEELFPFPQELKFQERKIGGRLYLVAPVYEAVIASTKSGKLQIEPFQISMYFSQNGGQRRQQLPAPFANDPFFSSMVPFGGGGSSIQVIAQSPPLTLDVKPLPDAGQPAGYGGAVGQFTASTEVDKKTARAYDDTIQLTLKIQGEGNTESLSPPTLPDLNGFTVLGEPTSESSGQKSGDKYVSTKTFTYTVRPTTPGSQKIPGIPFSYFDPATETYKSVQTDPIGLEVAPGTRPAPSPTPAADNDDKGNEQPAQPEADLRYISTQTLRLPNSGLRRLWGPIGVLLFLVPPGIVAVAGAVAIGRNRCENKRQNTRRLIRANSAQHLKEAAAALEAGETTRMAAELAEGIRLHFSSAFEISLGEVTIPEIEDRLTRAGAPADLVQGISRVLETCDSTQYAPSASRAANAQKTYAEAMDLLKASEEFA